MGNFRVGVCVHRPRRQLSVPGIRCTRTGTQAGPVDRPGHRPYATALASLVTPAAAAENFERLAELGVDGRFGFYEALDYTPRSREVETPSDASAQPTVVRAYFAHHQGMSLVALANVSCQDAFVGRFHSDPRVQATELLLQERVPREAILSEPRPVRAPRPRPRCR